MSLLLTGLPALSARAEPAPESAAAADQSAIESATKERARALHERGSRAYTEGRYYEAASEFLAAHRVYPTREFLFNVAKALDRLDNRAGALAYYREYVRADPGAADEEVKRRVEELSRALGERGVQQLSVISTPADAMVSLDGKPVGLTPWTGETWPGKHRLRVEREGYVAFDGFATVERQRADDVTLDLERLPPPAPAAAKPAKTEKTEEGSAVAPLTWIVLGTGTAALATALFVEMGHGERSGISRTGAFFAGAGLAGTALGGLLLYVDLSSAPSESRSGSTSAPPPATAKLRSAVVSLGARF